MKKNGKYCNGKKSMNMKPLAVLLALTLLVGCAVGGTLAWLTADGGTLTNTFTESNIDITLTETKPTDKTAPMVPGWTIEKDPKVTVVDSSEDCWLFVKITESTTPDLDTYISYEIADKYDATNNSDGWKIVQAEDTNGVTVIGRKVYKEDTVKAFDIIGYSNGDEFVANKVLVNETVTKQLMNAITGTGKAQPTLSFQAYAVQLFKTNNNNDKADTTDEFTMTEAWAKAVAIPSNS